MPCLPLFYLFLISIICTEKHSNERQFINDKEVQEISRNSSFKSTDQSG